MSSALPISDSPLFRTPLPATPTTTSTEITTRSYPFPVWSGLITAKHRQAMGNSVWTFLWFLDRVTEDKSGWGVVLGGRPVKDAEVADCFGVHKNTIAHDRDVLVEGRYIEAKRTPYGFRYRVRNSRKFGIWGKKRVTESCDSLPRESQETVTPESQKTVETKKTMQLDHAVKQQAASAKRKDLVWSFLGIDPCGSVQFRALLESCWSTRNGDLPSIVIGTVLDAWEAAEGTKPSRCAPLFKALAELRRREVSIHQPKKSRIPTGEQMIPKR